MCRRLFSRSPELLAERSEETDIHFFCAQDNDVLTVTGQRPDAAPRVNAALTFLLFFGTPVLF